MKNGGALRLTSRTDAKEEVMTILLILEFVAAWRIDFTPFMAGMMSSFSLSLVSYVKGYER